MTSICEIHLRTILDSRGNPTVEADVYAETGLAGQQPRAVPVLAFMRQK